MAVLFVWTTREEDQRLWVRGLLGTDEGVSSRVERRHFGELPAVEDPAPYDAPTTTR
jgi:hypothetical protein